jgi:ADP-ribosyl-[dinitrogen reductase] hydrolase
MIKGLLNQFSPFQPKHDSLYKKVIGGVLGFAVGDALGVPYEFKSRTEVQLVSKMTGYGSHKQPPGSWSDDSSMTFCLMEDLIEGYDIERLKERFCNWYYYGEWTHNNKLPFDIGQSTFKALSKIKAGIVYGETGLVDEKSNGNGSVMRVIPLCYALIHETADIKYPLIEEVSGITHAHIRSKIACSIYVETGIQLLLGNTPFKAYENMKKEIVQYYEGRGVGEELKRFERILKQDISTLQLSDIESSGYVVDSLEASLWSFLTTTNYKEAVLRAVRLGLDTDTIGAMTGGLAGLYYGEQSIPSKWRKIIARKRDIDELSKRFYESLIRKEERK